jgi:hypothetical protein
MKKTGVIILAIGLVMMVLSGFSFFTKEKIVDVGKIEITHNKKHSFDWSPVLGMVVMAVGAGVYLFGSKNNSIQITR